MARNTRAATARSKSKPAPVAGPDVHGSNEDSSHLDVEQEIVEAGSDDGEPEAEAVTPARKSGKRKAANHEDEDEDVSPDTKKPRVSVEMTEVVTSSAGKRRTHKEVRVEIPVSTTPATKTTGKHIVFNDDDGPLEFFTPQETPAKNPLDAQLSERQDEDEDGHDEAEEDSDDEAPEAVSTQTTAAHAAKSAHAAARAAEKQQELQKRKRQERDARFKQQTEARRKQQQQQEAVAEEADADADAGKASPEPPQPSRRHRHHLPGVASAHSRRRLDRHALPAMLPEEFLESDSEGSENDDEEDEEDARPKSKKVKLNTASKQVAKAESRHPQDQRVGSTVYRVMKKKGDDKLAPKMGKYSRNAREMLLGRGRPVGKKAGFAVKGR